MPLPQHNRGLGDLTSVLMPHCLVSRQFFLNESHIGQPRARSCIDAIAQLNHYVDVRLHEGEITEDFLASFQVLPGVIHAVIRRVQELTRELVGLHDTQVVVIANPSRFKQVEEYNRVCRAHGVRFILGTPNNNRAYQRPNRTSHTH